MAININKHFGNEIRRLREKQKLSQLELAGFASVDLSTINRLERGLGNVTLKNAFKISKALHVPIYEIFLVDKKSRREKRKGEIKGLPID